MKFGGTSVGSVERIEGVAKRVADHIKRTGDKVVLVVSAMSGETNRLIDLGRKVGGGEIPEREYHPLVASGEQVSSALTAIALTRLGVPACSLLAHQVELKTIERFGQNLIQSVNTEKLESLLKDGIVPVVAGFQGVDDEGDFTTLGRGGSDNTAVALAAALGKGCRCIIYTDVDGVYTALPSLCKNAKKLKNLNYEEMLELASGGAKVLQTRSVNLAFRHRVPLVVALSFEEVEGTEIVEEYPGMEDSVVSGVTHRTDESKLTMHNLPDEPGVAAQLFGTLGDAGVVVDMIVQSEGSDGKASISFTVPGESLTIAERVLKDLVKNKFTGSRLQVEKDMAKVTVVGEGMRTHAGIAAEMFKILGDEGINVEMISTSEIKISVVVNIKYAELAVRALHEHFIEKK